MTKWKNLTLSTTRHVPGSDYPTTVSIVEQSTLEAGMTKQPGGGSHNYRKLRRHVH